MDNLIPFSYIEKENGEIFTVRVVFTEGSFVGKKSYSKNRKKIKEHSIEDTVANIQIIEKKEISRYWTPPKVSSNSNFVRPQYISDIIKICENRDAIPYLIGSRLIGIEHTHSDWDLLIQYDKDIFELLNEFVSNIPKLRMFDDTEISERAFRYSYPNSPYNNYELINLFHATCSYLKWDDEEVGIFFVKTLERNYSSSGIFVKCLENTTIINEESDTFSMPRMFKVFCKSENKYYTIYSIDWLLYGVSESGITKLDFYNLRLIDVDTMILNEFNGYVRFR